MPPLFLFQSNLNGVLKPSMSNCGTGKESSYFVSVSINYLCHALVLALALASCQTCSYKKCLMD